MTKKKKCFAGPDHLGKYWCSCCEILLVCACVTAGLVPTGLSQHELTVLQQNPTEELPGEVMLSKVGTSELFPLSQLFSLYFPQNWLSGKVMIITELKAQGNSVFLDFHLFFLTKS